MGAPRVVITMRRQPLLAALLLSLLSLAASASAEPPPPSGIARGLAVKEAARHQGTLAALLSPSHPRPLHGATIEAQARNLLVLRDENGIIRRTGFDDLSTWTPILHSVHSLHGDHFDMVMVLTQWYERHSGAYYLPLANDIQGLGYQNQTGRDIFDDSDGNLDGLIFMNDYRTYLGRNQTLGRITFLQEIGHRWGTFVHVDKEGVPPNILLGRDQAHWSYFADSGNSALEGNDWDAQDNLFTSNTSAPALAYGDVDLYLMGLIPPEEVDPFFVIQNPDTRNLTDDYGLPLRPESPPAFSAPVTLPGERLDLTIQDIIAAEGPRVPSAETSQKSWRIATVLVINPDSEFGEYDLQEVSLMLDTWERWFEESTGHRAELAFNFDGSNARDAMSTLGEPCNSSQDCDQITATTCLALADNRRICSRGCAEHEDCTPDHCCARDFCYPAADEACQPQDPPPSEPDPPDTPHTPDPPTEPDENHPHPPEPRRAQPTGNTCQNSPGSTPSSLWPGAAILAIVASLIRRRR